MLNPLDYSPNDDVKDLVKKAKILFIVGPSGTGKNTIIEELSKSPRFHDIITATTRPPRENNGTLEKDGEVYHFVSISEFEEMVKKRELVEYAFVHNQNYYGTPVSEFIKCVNEDKIAIADIDVNGVKTFLNLNPNTKTIFLLPPNLETLLDRVFKRDQNNIDKADLKDRLLTSINEYNTAINTKNYIFVVNDNLDKALIEINQILEGNIPSQEEKFKLIETLKKQIEDYLKTL
jgi:guanylate kinase